MTNKDKLGYYLVGDLKFYSKLDAAHVSVKTNQPLTWHFNDEIFSSYDWTVNPNESLPELYRQRAQQLRDKYDYLVLWYSGGADSDNILNTFVDNNIRLDEAAGLVNMEATGDTYGYLNAEIYHLTAPKIEHIRNTSQSWLRHTIVDICKITVDYFTNQSNKFDWIYKSNQYVNPNYTARTQVVKTQKHWMDMINAGKRIGFIHGVDKPKIVGFNGRFYLVFRDILDAAAITHSQIDDFPGLFDEMFYWTADLPTMVIKQAHVIKNFLKQLPAESPFLSTVKNDRHPAIAINGRMHWITTDGIHTALYPNWHPVPYQVKPGSLIFSPRDKWFFDLPDNDIAKQTWRRGLDYRWQNTPNFLKNDPREIKHGFKMLTSRSYDIGP